MKPRVSSQPLNNVSIVLVRAENPANMGQVARAMKNFGVAKLGLVNCAAHQTDEAYTLGWKAREILDRAKLHTNLKKALRTFPLTIGFTSRAGKRRGAPALLGELIPRIVDAARGEKVALVFGNEKNGLANEELATCHLIATIPTARAYESLNLSHAVAVSLSAIFPALGSGRTKYQKPERYRISQRDLEALVKDFEEVMRRVGYETIKRQSILSEVLAQLEHFFKKASLERRELFLFKSLLSRIKERI